MIASDFTALDDKSLPESDAGTRAFESILREAIERRASDVYLLSDRDCVTVNLRRLGLVEKMMELPTELGRHVINVVKNCAEIDLVERRRPLDGRIELEFEGRPIDVRVNTLPTLFGEDATLRLLDPHQEVRTLDDLGLGAQERRRMVGLLDRPSGLILVTGPTGVGKTTTLYACLSRLNNGMRKINTLEDPIEYSIAGIRQSQVNSAIELTFSQLLASVLRQAPDVVMIGEVRDAETAATAVRAANSGHLVFATLHAPIAAGAIHSMLALGAAPHFLASSLVGVIAQRLVRRLCLRCRVSYELPGVSGVFDGVESLIEGEPGSVIYGPRGCRECGETGYSGRCAVYEVLTASARIRQQVAERRPRDELHAAAIAEGMISFRDASLAALAVGKSSLEEITRVIPRQVLGIEPQGG